MFLFAKELRGLHLAPHKYMKRVPIPSLNYRIVLPSPWTHEPIRDHYNDTAPMEYRFYNAPPGSDYASNTQGLLIKGVLMSGNGKGHKPINLLLSELQREFL